MFWPMIESGLESRPGGEHKLQFAIRSEFRLQAVPPAKAGTPNKIPPIESGLKFRPGGEHTEESVAWTTN